MTTGEAIGLLDELVKSGRNPTTAELLALHDCIVQAAAELDPDNPPLTPEQLERFSRGSLMGALMIEERISIRAVTLLELARQRGCPSVSRVAWKSSGECVDRGECDCQMKFLLRPLEET